MTMIEMGKVYKTRDNREVRIYAVDGIGRHPVHGAHRDEDDGWTAETWDLAGKFDVMQGTTNFDLIEVKPTIIRTVWLCWYVKPGGDRSLLAACVSEAEASRRRDDSEYSYLAITGPHTIEFTEGEGLS